MAQLLSRLLRTVVPTQHQWKLQLYERWPDIVGDLHGRVHIMKLYDTTLIVGVNHPAWAQEIFMLSEFLRIKINTVLGSEKIKFLRVQVAVPRAAKINKGAAPKKPFAGLHKKAHARGTLTSREQVRLNGVQCSELRDALVSYLDRCSSENK